MLQIRFKYGISFKIQAYLVWVINQIFFIVVGHFSNGEKVEEAQAAIRAVPTLVAVVVDPKSLPLTQMLHRCHTRITYNTKKIIRL